MFVFHITFYKKSRTFQRFHYKRRSKSAINNHVIFAIENSFCKKDADHV